MDGFGLGVAPQNVFRPEYRELDEAEKSRVDQIKNLAQQLYDLYPFGRGGALAKTKLEESVMWAVKEITGPRAAAGNTMSGQVTEKKN